MASLRPVLDSHDDPVMSSGNFAVVFKMRDENKGSYIPSRASSRIRKDEMRAIESMGWDE
ncbi:MAG: hypothetical protein K2K75_12815 [Muribaculaceae bacterium]|nr:hypothetical protein [Muribaculaceae bacterium]